jgi:ADP-heptose:LPS heptosyltransferase
VRSLVGETSLRQLCALSARARLFVGCDSGPMHVAAAQGTPVVALFGPADPRRTGPYGAGHRVVRVPPPCAPCNRRTCNQPRHACMEDISVARVLAAARDVLAGAAVG